MDRYSWWLAVAVAAALIGCSSPQGGGAGSDVVMHIDPATGGTVPLDGSTLTDVVEVFLATDRSVGSLAYTLGDSPPFAVTDDPDVRVTLDPGGHGEGTATLTVTVTGPGGAAATVAATFHIAAAAVPGGDDGSVGGDGAEGPPGGDDLAGVSPDPETPPDQSGPTEPEAPVRAALSWSPPVLSSPTTIHVGVTGGIGRLDTTRDYVLVMPQVPRREGLVIDGGRNVVLIGGEIFIPHQGSNPTINQRRALYVANATGTVHVEGLLLHGDDISEGVQVRAPNAIVQLQNLAVLNVHARDQIGFTDNHPDVIQTWGSVKELRVDHLTGETDYQGLFFKADYNGPHGPVHLRNVNMRALPTARYLFWTSNQGGGYPTMTLDQVWVAPAATRSFSRSVWPESGSVVTGGTASWPNLPITGVVRHGLPPGGDFVPADRVGIGYVTPGYR